MKGAVLITGTTGFVGMELLARYLERSDREIYALVRADDDASARERIDTVLENLFGSRVAKRYADRVHPIAGELTAPGLGLGAERSRELAREVSTIVHSAASVSFTLPLDEAREINVEGTRRMLEFAELVKEHGGLERYGHVSTAYVAGTHDGSFAECDLDVGQEFNNSYEQSKFEAEQLVRAKTELPTTIMRPSIVVGDRQSGWTSAFNVLYWPLRAFARGMFESVPAVSSAPVDVVSVDYVADAIYELCESDGGIGETYHLTAGAQASTIGEIAKLRQRLLSAAGAEGAAARRVRDRSRLPRGPGAGRQQGVLPVLLDPGRFRLGRHAGPARARRDPRLAAGRLPRATARLRDPQPLGQAPDHARRSRRSLISRSR